MNYTMILIAALTFVLLTGCLGGGPNAMVADNGNTTAGNGAVTTEQPSQNNSTQVINVTKTGNPIVVFETTKGTFTAEIYLKEAPITSTNFLKLVNSKFYDGLTFHRVIPGFVAQGGDPKGDGTGGSNQTIPLEIVPGLTHKLGALAMARTNDPNSATSQFYIVLDAASCAQLDGSYAVFGQVQGSGMDVVNKLVVGDKMTRVYVQQ
jgi:peptidyl-prolyl cis-trans isomerase B (cyclophilin B)